MGRIKKKGVIKMYKNTEYVNLLEARKILSASIMFSLVFGYFITNYVSSLAFVVPNAGSYSNWFFWDLNYRSGSMFLTSIRHTAKGREYFETAKDGTGKNICNMFLIFTLNFSITYFMSLLKERFVNLTTFEASEKPG